MHKIKSVLIVAFLSAMQITLFAQNTTNSPYTRYGYGELSDQSFAGQRAMGGIGYGLRDPKMINPINPAAFSSVDSMTFMIDMGLTAQMSWYKEGDKSASKLNGRLEYIAMQFPLYKRLGMGVGFKPISNVGYEYGEAQKLGAGTYQNWLYSGSGGLSQVYATLSYDIAKRLSLGINAGYVFGNVVHDRYLNSNETSSYTENLVDTLSSRGFSFDVGLQYVQPLGKDRRLVFGGVYSPKIKLQGDASKSLVIYDPLASQVTKSYYEMDKDSKFSMPESYGFGLTFNQLNKMTVGADVLYQKWADADFFSKTDTLKNRTKLNLGGEYIIDSRSRSLFKRISYRAGINYSDSYIKVQGAGYNEYGASVGFGIPMLDNRSYINLTFEYKAIRPELKTLVDEQYFKFTFSYTFNELWFLKRKMQ